MTIQELQRAVVASIDPALRAARMLDAAGRAARGDGPPTEAESMAQAITALAAFARWMRQYPIMGERRALAADRRRHPGAWNVLVAGLETIDTWEDDHA